MRFLLDIVGIFWGIFGKFAFYQFPDMINDFSVDQFEVPKEWMILNFRLSTNFFVLPPVASILAQLYPYK